MKRRMALLVGLALLVSGRLLAGTIYVDDDAPGDPGPGDPMVSDPLEDGTADHPYDAIQEGIDDAVGGDTVLVADGTYAGSGNKDLDFGGKAITLQSENGAATTIIDCENDGRGLYFHNEETTSSAVDGFTITNGAVSGGGIFCSGSDPTITNCTISGNSADWYGGGIFCGESSPTITNCTITNNSAKYDTGGGIHCMDNSSPTITDCTITGNSARVNGGGISCQKNSSPIISNCTISGNTAGGYGGYGGGIDCFDNSSPTIISCAISGNSALHGGGISSYWYSSPAIRNCTISDNSASVHGGGIACYSYSSPAITNCTVGDNSAVYNGGGIYCSNSGPTITNSTISGNAADYCGGGIHSDFLSSPAMTNCILWGNTAPTGHEIALTSTNKPSTLIVRYGDVQGGAGEAYVDPGCTLDMDTTNIGDDPDDNPLLTPDGHLTAGSPCIDWCPTGAADDRDGEARPFPVGGGYDIGSDEFVDTDGDGLPDWWETKFFGSPTAAEPAVDEEPDSLTNLEEYESDTHPLHADNPERTYYVSDAAGDDAYDGLAAAYDGTHGPKLTIQAGIDATITGWDYTVLVADGTYTGVGNRDLDFGGKAITVCSENGAASTIIDCEATELDYHRGFWFHSGETLAAVVDGFTVTNGYVADDVGGGILCWTQSNPTIANCTIGGNTAGRHGGGIFCYKSDPGVTDCTISGNEATWCGGGIGCEESSPTVTDCVITGNSADIEGGGIYGYLSGPHVTGCTIDDNSAALDGGAVSSNSSSPTFAKCTMSGNTAGDDGGGIDCYNSDLTLTHCTILGNTTNDEGGGIWFWMSDGATVANCMIVGNSALATSGGIGFASSSPSITNCTISGNSAFLHVGGGVGCFEGSSPTMTNCILWGNTAPTGHEIALASTGWPSTLTIRHSDVQGGTGEADVEPGCTLDIDGTCIDADPLFVTGPLHGCYLSQIAAGQLADSPCVDTGSDTAANLGLDALTTRTDGVTDTGVVDMGYHAPPAIFGDVDGNMVVDGLDLTAVLTAWETEPGDPLWNPNADLDGNGVVDGLDLTEVISNWTTGAGAASPRELGPPATEALESGPKTVKAGAHESRPGNVRMESGKVRRK